MEYLEEQSGLTNFVVFLMISNKIVKCILINLFVMENSNNVQTISLSNAKSNKY